MIFLPLTNTSGFWKEWILWNWMGEDRGNQQSINNQSRPWQSTNELISSKHPPGFKLSSNVNCLVSRDWVYTEDIADYRSFLSTIWDLAISYPITIIYYYVYAVFDLASSYDKILHLAATVSGITYYSSRLQPVYLIPFILFAKICHFEISRDDLQSHHMS